VRSTNARGTSGRLPRRRGELFQVDWDEVDGLTLSDAEQGTHSLLSVLSGLRAADVAHALQGMPGKRRLQVAAALDDERLAAVLQGLPEDDQGELLSSLGDE